MGHLIVAWSLFVLILMPALYVLTFRTKLNVAFLLIKYWPLLKASIAFLLIKYFSLLQANLAFLLNKCSNEFAPVLSLFATGAISSSLLTDMITFEIAIVSVVVPLSFAIVSQISERYSSDVIMKSFIQSVVNKKSLLTLLAVIGAFVLLKFSLLKSEDQHYGGWLALTTLTAFFGSCAWLFYVICQTLNYSDSGQLMDGFFKQAEAILNGNSPLVEDKIMNVWQGIGDVLMFETVRKNEERVCEDLRKLHDQFKNLITTPYSDEKGFGKLVSKDYLELYLKNKNEALARKLVRPELVLPSFTRAIEQFFRIQNISVNNMTFKISSRTIAYLNGFARELATAVSNDIFLGQVLAILISILRIALKEKEEVSVGCVLEWYWYITGANFGKTIDARLLPIINNYFTGMCVLLIDSNETRYFKRVVHMLADQNDNWPDGIISNIGSGLAKRDAQLYQQVDQSINLQSRLDSLAYGKTFFANAQELNHTFEQLKEIMLQLSVYLTSTEQSMVNELEQVIRKNGTGVFVRTQLYEVFLWLGAYCLKEDKADFTRIIWETHQPATPHMTWLGNNVIPRNILELLSIFCAHDARELELFKFEDRDLLIYLDRYVLLLFVHLLLKGDSTIGRIPNLKVQGIYRLKMDVERLAELSPKMLENRDLLIQLGFPSTELDSLFSETVPQKLKETATNAERSINTHLESSPLFEENIESFSQKFLDNYVASIQLRPLLLVSRPLINYTDHPAGESSSRAALLQFREFIFKEIFIQDWYQPIMGIPEELGRAMGEWENEYLVNEILKRCGNESIDKFIDKLSQMSLITEILILASPLSLSFLSRLSQFSLNISRSSFHPVEPYGYLEINNTLIAIHEVSTRTMNNPAKIIIAQRKNFGRVVQLNPCNNADEEASKKGIFYLSISELSTETAPNMQQATAMGVTIDQAIRTKVLLDIRQRLCYVPRSEQIGFVFNPNL